MKCDQAAAAGADGKRSRRAIPRPEKRFRLLRQRRCRRVWRPNQSTSSILQMAFARNHCPAMQRIAVIDNM